MSRNQFPFFLFFSFSFSFSFFSFSFSFFSFFCEYFPSVTANIMYLVNRICIGIRYTVESFTGCTVGKNRVKFFPSKSLSVYYWPFPSWTVDQRTTSFSYNYRPCQILLYCTMHTVRTNPHGVRYGLEAQDPRSVSDAVLKVSAVRPYSRHSLWKDPL